MENKKVKVTDIIHEKDVYVQFGISSQQYKNLKKWLRPMSINSERHYKKSDIKALIEDGYAGDVNGEYKS
tara:strand:- start:363 stop:572 length:210 start_codon:yes stop_codon:yes gene_type:complete